MTDPVDADVPTVITPPPGEASPPPDSTPAPAAPRRAFGAEPLIGQHLGGCRIDDLLGRGGMGAAYSARHLGLDRPVVVKVLPPAYAGSDELRERFLREARATARLNHPNVVQVHDVGEQDGVVFYVMELIEGESLQDLVQRRGRLPFDEATRLVLDVARGLVEAHEAGVVHRDIKPANVLVSRKGQAKVLDFGLALDVASEGLSATGQMLGTPHYMAPEQADGQADARSDLYSLGITYYRLLTGEHPFEGSSALVVIRKHLDEPPPRLRERVPEAPACVEGLILRLMEKDPARRPQTAGETVRALEDVLRALSSGEPAPRAGPPIVNAATSPLPRAALALAALAAPLVFMATLTPSEPGAPAVDVTSAVTSEPSPGPATATEPPSPSHTPPPRTPPPPPGRAPTLVLEPATGGLTSSRDLRLVGRLDDVDGGVTVVVDGAPTPLVDGQFEVALVALDDGEHRLPIVLLAGERTVVETSWVVRVDATPPALSWTAAPRVLRLDDAGATPAVEVSIAVAGEQGAVRVVAGVTSPGAVETPLSASGDGAFVGAVPLEPRPGRMWVGRVPVHARASDEAGNAAELTAEVVVVPRGMVLVEPGPAARAFFVDRDEVTVGALTRFLRETGRAPPRRWDPTGPGLPAQHVSCHLADAYAAWRGRRLPTEREWELAAGWRDGRLLRFPWGDDDRPDVDANVARRGRAAARQVGASADDVGPWGCRDMAGNVSEWVVAGEERRLKGGNYSVRQLVGAAIDAPGSARDPALELEHVGFRCARDLAFGEEVDP